MSLCRRTDGNFINISFFILLNLPCFRRSHSFVYWCQHLCSSALLSTFCVCDCFKLTTKKIKITHRFLCSRSAEDINLIILVLISLLCSTIDSFYRAELLWWWWWWWWSKRAHPVCHFRFRRFFSHLIYFSLHFIGTASGHPLCSISMIQTTLIAVKAVRSSSCSAVKQLLHSFVVDGTGRLNSVLFLLRSRSTRIFVFFFSPFHHLNIYFSFSSVSLALSVD